MAIQEIPEAKFLWPVQSKPNQKAWKLWETTIRRIYLQGECLKQSLGYWTAFKNRYEWWYDHTTDTVIHKPSRTRRSITNTRRKVKLNQQLGTATSLTSCSSITELGTSYETYFTISPQIMHSLCANRVQDSSRWLVSRKQCNTHIPPQMLTYMADSIWIVACCPMMDL